MTERVDFDDYSDDYDQIMERQLSFMTKDHTYFAQYKLAVIARLLSSAPRRILDFGCGVGRNLGLFQQHFQDAQVAGADLSAGSLPAAARAHEGVQLYDLTQEQLPEAHFDLVFLAGVVHHIPIDQRPTVFGQILQCMSAGGTLFIFEHNPLNPMTQKIVRDCPFDGDAVLIRRGRLGALLEQAGFTLRRSRYLLFFPPVLHRRLGRLEGLRGWCPLGGQYVVQAELSVQR